MKLRIRGDSLRLRLTQGEVDRLRDEGRVEEVMHVAPGQALTYVLERATGENRPNVSFEEGRVRVRLPAEQAIQWASSNEVGIEAEQPSGDHTLRILVEKDFKCLTTREGEDDSDAFENPNASC